MRIASGNHNITSNGSFLEGKKSYTPFRPRPEEGDRFDFTLLEPSCGVVDLLKVQVSETRQNRSRDVASQPLPRHHMEYNTMRVTIS